MNDEAVYRTAPATPGLVRDCSGQWTVDSGHIWEKANWANWALFNLSPEKKSDSSMCRPQKPKGWDEAYPDSPPKWAKYDYNSCWSGFSHQSSRGDSSSGADWLSGPIWDNKVIRNQTVFCFVPMDRLYRDAMDSWLSLPLKKDKTSINAAQSISRWLSRYRVILTKILFKIMSEFEFFSFVTILVFRCVGHLLQCKIT